MPKDRLLHNNVIDTTRSAGRRSRRKNESGWVTAAIILITIGLLATRLL